MFSRSWWTGKQHNKDEHVDTRQAEQTDIPGFHKSGNWEMEKFLTQLLMNKNINSPSYYIKPSFLTLSIC